MIKKGTIMEYDLLDALRSNPTLIMAGADICKEAADEIERLRAEIKFASEMLAACREMLPPAQAGLMKKRLAQISHKEDQADD
jgi:hypothetical protein